MNGLTALGLLVLIAAPPVAVSQVTETEDHIVTRVAEGVYAIRHKRAVRIGAYSGNTTVIIGDRDVLVVDPGSLPSIAAGDIALIRRWTSKPVRYVVNTHWHGDHTWGNGAYQDSFPGVTIIAHRETPGLMQGYLPRFVSLTIANAEQLARTLESGKEADGSPLTEARRADLRAGLPNARLLAAEYANMVTRLPNLTIAHELTLDLGSREVQVTHLGRGNTSSDVVVFLPGEKVVMTGDLLVYPYQYFLGGFPNEWSRTLERVAQLGATTLVPGHGAVLTGDDGTAYLDLIKEWLDVVTVAVRTEVFKVGNVPPNDSDELQRGHLNAVRAALKTNPEIARFRQRFAKNDPDRLSFFDGALPNVIDSAYRETWGN